MTFSYHSPLSAEVGLLHRVVPPGASLWGYQGIITVMSLYDPSWPGELRDWYFARRDANLMGICPVCKTVWPLIRSITGLQYGSMVHEDECVVADYAWLDAKQRQLLS